MFSSAGTRLFTSSLFKTASHFSPSRSFFSGARSRFTSSLTNSLIPTPRFHFDANYLPLLGITLAGSLACYLMLKDYVGPREIEVFHSRLDLTKNNHHGFIVDASKFTYVGPKPAGELSGCIVKDNATGKIYLKKGAQSKDALIKEFVISDFLALVRPGEQPASHIMQETQPDGSARLYTLSEMLPGSMDLEKFVSLGNYKEKFAEKPLLGFEVALASDCMFAKQADIKFANLIIIETETNYIVATIDHEMSGKGMHAKRAYIADIDKLIDSIRDVNPAINIVSEETQDLADIRLATEFIAAARPFMHRDNVIDFFRKVAFTKQTKVIGIIDEIYGEDGLVESAEAKRYLCELLQVQDGANASFNAGTSRLRTPR